MSRLLVILTLLAAAVPAAASAQTPTPEPPVATTGAPDSITETAANLNGSVDPNGSPTTYHFEYGTTAGYGLTTPESDAPEGTGPAAVKAAISGLTRNTIYHYRLVATNAAGVSRGSDITFRTATGPQAPSLRSTSAHDVFSRGARLLTSADPNGQPTTVRFEYGRTTRYGSSTDRVDVGSGTSAVPVSINVDGLQPNTRYHFRAVATNATGSARSVDRAFRTTREPRGVSLGLRPSRVLWGGRLTVVGRVTGTGVGGTRVALEKQDFPFQSSFTEIASRTASRSGTFSFNVGRIFAATHYRVVTRTQVPVASRIRTASSVVKVSARGRSQGRRRVRIKGTIWPQVSRGRVSLQKRSPHGGWAVVKRQRAKRLGATRSRYSFSVLRGKRTPKRPIARYRVVVLPRDAGAHVTGRSRTVRVAGVRRAR